MQYVRCSRRKAGHYDLKSAEAKKLTEDQPTKPTGLRARSAALAIAAIVGGGVIWSGCGSGDDATSSINDASSTAQEQIEKGTTEAEKGIDEGVERAEEGLDEAQEQIEEGKGEASKQVEEAKKKAEEGLEKGKAEAEKGVEKAEELLP